MGENNRAAITVYRTHGEPLKFEVEWTEAKTMGLGEDIEQALSRSALAIEANGTLYIIPYSNIQHIECTPAPEVLPLNMIRNAKFISN
jgi:hypothetical protein